ncbi:MAG: hypothetical protein PHU25_05520 [Deltaproteobacteria bacterium]|nr:hypothetical protein [Deltaproteobacteria bacterium]
MELFRALVNELQKEAPPQQRPRIRYLTFWKETEQRLRQVVNRDDEVVFLPERMRCVSLDRAKIIALEQKERKLIDQGMTPLKTMMECERFAPTNGQAAEDFMWRSFAAHDELIPENTILLSNEVDHVCYWIACDLCNVRNGRFFGFGVSGRPSDYTQVVRNTTNMWTLNKPTEEHYHVVDRQIQEIESGVLPSYMYKTNPYPKLRNKAEIIFSRMKEAHAGNYFMKWPTILAPGLQKAKELKWNLFGSGVKHWNLDEIVRPFVYFPLHLEPEATTSVYAPYFKYQDIVIDWLAKSLPAGVDLVLKENPKMWGNRSRRFYQNAARIPGVRWIDPRTSSRDLTLKSSAVVTITGTVAIEALALNKPVAIMGNPPYGDALKCIPRMKNPEELVAGLVSLLESKIDREVFRREYATYIANLINKPFNNIRRESNTPYPVYVFHKEHAKYVRGILNW